MSTSQPTRPNDLSFLSRERAEVWGLVWSRDKKLKSSSIKLVSPFGIVMMSLNLLGDLRRNLRIGGRGSLNA